MVPYTQQLLRVPFDSKEVNQLVLKETNSGYSLERLMLNLKLQYFGHLMRRANLLEKTLMLGKIEDRRRRGQQRMRWLDGITDSVDIEFGQTRRDSEGQGSLAAAVHGIAKSRTRLSDSTTTTATLHCFMAEINVTL